MRLVQVWIPQGKQQTVLEKLDSMEIEYTVSDEVGREEYVSVVTFPLHTAAVESALEDLRSVGIDEDTYTIVLAAETVISEAFDEQQEEQVEEADEEDAGITGRVRIAREELESRSRELVLSLPTYIVLTLVSAIIATAGLLLDSPATVVGSMVIAPLIGPSLAASVGTVLNDRDLFRRGVSMQLLGIVVAIVGATVFGFLVRSLYLVPPGLEVMNLAEIAERGAPNVLVLAIALGAGIAGMLSLMTGVSTALVGVMIAVALIPPAAAVGVGIAFEEPALALGASVIVVVNALSINLSSLLLLWFEGYRPSGWLPSRELRSTLFKQVGVLVVAIGLVSMFLFGVTYDSYVASTTENEIRTAIVDELEQIDEDLELRELRIERTGLVPPLDTDRVVIVITIPYNAEIPPLVDRLTEEVEAITETEVDVAVEFVLVQS